MHSHVVGRRRKNRCLTKLRWSRDDCSPRHSRATVDLGLAGAVCKTAATATKELVYGFPPPIVKRGLKKFKADDGTGDVAGTGARVDAGVGKVRRLESNSKPGRHRKRRRQRCRSRRRSRRGLPSVVDRKLIKLKAKAGTGNVAGSAAGVGPGVGAGVGVGAVVGNGV